MHILHKNLYQRMFCKVLVRIILCIQLIIINIFFIVIYTYIQTDTCCLHALSTDIAREHNMNKSAFINTCYILVCVCVCVQYFTPSHEKRKVFPPHTHKQTHTPQTRQLSKVKLPVVISARTHISLCD